MRFTDFNIQKESLKNRQISPETLFKTCKFGQGNECCKYIVFFDNPKNFFCAKNIAKEFLDKQNTTACGNNCEGL